MGMGHFFKIAKDHHSAAEEMHKRVAYACDESSIIWHISIWPDAEIRAAETVDKQNSLKDLWLGKINMRLNRMLEVIGDTKPNAKFQFSTSKNKLNKSKKSLSYKMIGNGFTWRIKAESHFEFVTITNIVSFHTTKKDVQAHNENTWPEKKLGISLSEASKAFDDLIKNTQNKNSTKDLCNLLYSKLWVTYAKEVCRVHDGIDEFSQFPGFLIADFRGAVIPVYRNKKISTKTKGEIRAAYVVREYENLIGSVQLSKKNMEFVVCSMLKYKAIYASTLGSYLNDDISSSPTFEEDYTSPVLFSLMLNESLNKKQIGRLVERINALGVSRIAALKGLDGLRIVGREIQAMGARLNKIIAMSDKKDDKPALVEQFLIDLNNLTNGYINKDSSLVEGVTYRISRSDYYANLIDTRLPDLRIERIEGWQPYDEFLRRRLFPTFKFVKEIGSRIRVLRRRLDTLQMNIEIKQSKELLDELRRIQGNIEGDETSQTALLKEQKETDQKQDKLNYLLLILTVFTVLFGTIGAMSDWIELNATDKIKEILEERSNN